MKVIEINISGDYLSWYLNKIFCVYGKVCYKLVLFYVNKFFFILIMDVYVNILNFCNG